MLVSVGPTTPSPTPRFSVLNAVPAHDRPNCADCYCRLRSDYCLRSRIFASCATIFCRGYRSFAAAGTQPRHSEVLIETRHHGVQSASPPQLYKGEKHSGLSPSLLFWFSALHIPLAPPPSILVVSDQAAWPLQLGACGKGTCKNADKLLRPLCQLRPTDSPRATESSRRDAASASGPY